MASLYDLMSKFNYESELDIIQKGYATVEFSLYKKIPLLYETLEAPFPLRFTREKNNQDSYFVQNKD